MFKRFAIFPQLRINNNKLLTLENILIMNNDETDSTPSWWSLYNDNPLRVAADFYDVGDTPHRVYDAYYYYLENRKTCVEDFYFEGREDLTSIEIPSSFVGIGIGCFSGCKNLTNVVIPDTVNSISSNVFENCVSLRGIIFPEGVYSISQSIFRGCTNLISFRIPDSVICIEKNAFCGCTSLKNIVIPKNVKTVFSKAFANCTHLECVHIEGNDVHIDNDVFCGCHTLKHIYLSRDTKIRNEGGKDGKYQFFMTTLDEQNLRDTFVDCPAKIHFIS